MKMIWDIGMFIMDNITTNIYIGECVSDVIFEIIFLNFLKREYFSQLFEGYVLLYSR